MEDFDTLIQDAQKQAKQAGLKGSDIQAAIAKARTK